MNTAYQKNSTQRTAHTCRVCGQEARTGSVVQHIGWVGPDCKRKVAALHQTLEQNGLTEMFEGRVEFYPVESEDADGLSMWTWPLEINALRRRAEALGLKFCWHWAQTDGPAEGWIRLPDNRKARKRLFERQELEQRHAA